MSDVSEEQAHAMPPGKANSLAASYAHLIVSEDLIVNGVLRGAPPMMASNYAGRTGLSEPMPMPGPEWARYSEWARDLRIDMPAFRAYASAVYAATDNYLAGVTDDDLDRTLDLSSLGLGTRTVGWVIGRLLIGHTDNMCGECSALKGMQGLTGYPQSAV
jgi:hypothetical protein